MSDKTQWDIEHLQKKADQHEAKLNSHDKRLAALQSFKDSTVEKLLTIFKSIEEIKEESRWMKRSFTTALIGGIVTAVVSLVIWLIQN
ncbi:uncharacterized coiled-coil DUF342 family protein [Virgibacillus halotolerans]|uniref:hemolysin XhlA family protein n=1 Tax=Virgibacillus halotolerans TaxID=1071053 RepID=UPI00195F72A3|nr:uncharacterized coiled-coil DUF342 family protein [Virgibacillus halotolerans]